MRETYSKINGGTAVRIKDRNRRMTPWAVLVFLMLLTLSSSAFAQGSIFGNVNNSDLTTPANGEISFFGYLDDTDQEIRLELCDGAGYDAGNWFDDFQNYLTEGPGNPYDYHFYNVVNGEGFHLADLIPNNSFQQEDIVLAAGVWPAQPVGLTGRALSGTTVLLTWTGTPGLTYHVYRRSAASNGSFFRLDNPTGNLADVGVADSFFVDNTSDGASSYDYIIIADDGAGNLSPHSAVLTVDASALVAPTLVSIDPDHGPSIGGNLVNVYGTDFDVNGATVQFGTIGPVIGTVISPYHLTAQAPVGTAGSVEDIYVTNNASALVSNTLTAVYTYDANQAPVIAAINDTSIVEGENLVLAVTATDIDGTTPVLTALNVPVNATFTDNTDGTGTFDFSPDFTQANVYTVTFIADDGIAADSLDVVVTVTEAGNQFPVLDTIPDTTVAEGGNLAFTVTASDPDGTAPSLLAAGLPTNAALVDNLDGTASFTFDPDMDQEGAYTVTFIADDGELADSQDVQITVTGVNQVPVIDPIPDTTINEGDSLMILVTATDADGTIPTLTALNLPLNALFTDSLNGVGTFEFYPDFTQGNVYTVSFVADDGIDADTLDVVITVNDVGNLSPIFVDMPDTTINEGDTLAILLTAVDPDGTTPVLTAINLPANAIFEDSLNGTGAFTFLPDYTQAGDYTVTFIADDGLLADSMDVLITVNDLGNLPPVFVTVPDTIVNEGQVLVLDVSATDPDGTPGVFPVLSISTTIDDYTFVDYGDGTGQFTYSPTFFDAGIDSISFFATDAGTPQQTGVERVEVVTADVNQPPVIDTIGPFGATVGGILTFVVSATDSTDPDAGHTIQLSVVNPPANSDFVDHGDNTGTFTLEPDSSQIGSLSVTFLAVDQGVPALSSTLPVTIDVQTVNAAPVFVDFVQSQIGTEGETISLTVLATDADGTTPVLSADNLPENATFLDFGDGTGAFDFTPDYTQGGSTGNSELYGVTFKAYDGFVVTREVTLIQVMDAGNQAPYFDSVPSPSVTEIETLEITLTATDPDGFGLTFTVDEGTLPPNASFVDNGDNSCTITFTPDYTQQGDYDITITVSDGELDQLITMTVTVIDAGPQPPVLDPISNNAFDEFSGLTFDVTCSDPDGVPPILTAYPLPGTATFTDNGDFTGTFDWTSTYEDSGRYFIWFKATDVDDPSLADSQEVTIVVVDVNQEPRVTFVWTTLNGFPTDNSGVTMYEQDTLVQLIQTIDNDGDPPSIVCRLSGEDTLAANMVFVDSGNGNGTLTFIPGWDQGAADANGEAYNVTYDLIDARYPEVVVETAQPRQFLVLNRNQPPWMYFTLDTLPFTMFEGEGLVFDVYGIDPDGATRAVLQVVGSLPLNASATGSQDSLHFQFYPNFTQSGTYVITFSVTDVGGITVNQDITITVVDAGNQAPLFTTNLARTTSVPSTTGLNLQVVAFDPDGESVTLTAEPILEGATFTDHGDGTGNYVYMPDASEDGNSYDISFIATDPNGVADTMVVTLQVVSFLRGDFDFDSKYTMNDLACLIDFLFRDGPEPAVPDAADVNNDTSVNIIDITYMIRFLYQSGPPPPM